MPVSIAAAPFLLICFRKKTERRELRREHIYFECSLSEWTLPFSNMDQENGISLSLLYLNCTLIKIYFYNSGVEKCEDCGVDKTSILNKGQY